MSVNRSDASGLDATRRPVRRRSVAHRPGDAPAITTSHPSQTARCACNFPLLSSDDGCPRCKGFTFNGRALLPVGRGEA